MYVPSYVYVCVCVHSQVLAGQRPAIPVPAPAEGEELTLTDFAVSFPVTAPPAHGQMGESRGSAGERDALYGPADFYLSPQVCLVTRTHTHTHADTYTD